MEQEQNKITTGERNYALQATQLPPVSERKSALRQAILRRVPGISSAHLDLICKTVNPNRRYFIKSTASKQKFLNLTTRETIITKDIRAFSEVLPLYGSFQPPYFEKVGERRTSREGELDPSIPAAAVKIRAGVENKYSSATYSLVIFLAEQTTTSTA